MSKSIGCAALAGIAIYISLFFGTVAGAAYIVKLVIS